eukprot:scaffold9520_cov105-Cylindrotheca_fusiformis.AAC.3
MSAESSSVASMEEEFEDDWVEEEYEDDNSSSYEELLDDADTDDTDLKERSPYHRKSSQSMNSCDLSMDGSAMVEFDLGSFNGGSSSEEEPDDLEKACRELIAVTYPRGGTKGADDMIQRCDLKNLYRNLKQQHKFMLHSEKEKEAEQSTREPWESFDGTPQGFTKSTTFSPKDGSMITMGSFDDVSLDSSNDGGVTSKAWSSQERTTKWPASAHFDPWALSEHTSHNPDNIGTEVSDDENDEDETDDEEEDDDETSEDDISDEGEEDGKPVVGSMPWLDLYADDPEDYDAACRQLIPLVYKNKEGHDPDEMLRRSNPKDLFRHLKHQHLYTLHVGGISENALDERVDELKPSPFQRTRTIDDIWVANNDRKAPADQTPFEQKDQSWPSLDEQNPSFIADDSEDELFPSEDIEMKDDAMQDDEAIVGTHKSNDENVASRMMGLTTAMQETGDQTGSDQQMEDDEPEVINWLERYDDDPDDYEVACRKLIAVLYKDDEEYDPEATMRRTSTLDLFRYLQQAYWYEVHMGNIPENALDEVDLQSTDSFGPPHTFQHDTSISSAVPTPTPYQVHEILDNIEAESDHIGDQLETESESMPIPIYDDGDHSVGSDAVSTDSSAAVPPARLDSVQSDTQFQEPDINSFDDGESDDEFDDSSSSDSSSAEASPGWGKQVAESIPGADTLELLQNPSHHEPGEQKHPLDGITDSPEDSDSSSTDSRGKNTGEQQMLNDVRDDEGEIIESLPSAKKQEEPQKMKRRDLEEKSEAADSNKRAKREINVQDSMSNKETDQRSEMNLRYTVIADSNDSSVSACSAVSLDSVREQELMKLVSEAEENLDETFDKGAIDALRIATINTSQSDASADGFTLVPVVARAIVDNTLIQAASKLYSNGNEELPLEYSAALRVAASMALGEDIDYDYIDNSAASAEEMGEEGSWEWSNHTSVSKDSKKGWIAEREGPAQFEPGRSEAPDTNSDPQSIGDLRKSRIEAELLQIIMEAEEKELDDPMDPEAISALKFAAAQTAHLKKYYDVFRDEFLNIPPVAKALLDMSLVEEAAKHYCDGLEEFPPEYIGALRTVASEVIDEDLDYDYMSMLGVDIDGFGNLEGEKEDLSPIKSDAILLAASVLGASNDPTANLGDMTQKHVASNPTSSESMEPVKNSSFTAEVPLSPRNDEQEKRARIMDELQRKEDVSPVQNHSNLSTASVPEASNDLTANTRGMTQKHVASTSTSLESIEPVKNSNFTAAVPLSPRNDEQGRRTRIMEELQRIVVDAERNELGKSLDQGVVRALEIAAIRTSHLKRYYDFIKDVVLFLPPVAKAIADNSLLEAAAVHYHNRPFPPKYIAALQAAARRSFDDSLDYEYMENHAVTLNVDHSDDLNYAPGKAVPSSETRQQNADDIGMDLGTTQTMPTSKNDKEYSIDGSENALKMKAEPELATGRLDSADNEEIMRLDEKAGLLYSNYCRQKEKLAEEYRELQETVQAEEERIADELDSLNKRRQGDDDLLASESQKAEKTRTEDAALLSDEIQGLREKLLVARGTLEDEKRRFEVESIEKQEAAGADGEKGPGLFGIFAARKRAQDFEKEKRMQERLMQQKLKEMELEENVKEIEAEISRMETKARQLEQTGLEMQSMLDKKAQSLEESFVADGAKLMEQTRHLEETFLEAKAILDEKLKKLEENRAEDEAWYRQEKSAITSKSEDGREEKMQRQDMSAKEDVQFLQDCADRSSSSSASPAKNEDFDPELDGEKANISTPDHLLRANQPARNLSSDSDSLEPSGLFDAPVEPRPEKPLLAAALKAKEAIDKNGIETFSDHQVSKAADALGDLGLAPTSTPDHLVGAHQPVRRRSSDLDSLAPVDVLDAPAQPQPEQPLLAAAVKAKEAIDKNGNNTAAANREVDEESDSLRDLGVVPTTVPDHLVGAHQPVIKRPSDLDSLAPVDVFDAPTEPRPEKPFLAAALKAKEAIDRNGNSTATSNREVDEESDSLRDLGMVPTTVPDHLIGAHQPVIKRPSDLDSLAPVDVLDAPAQPQPEQPLLAAAMKAKEAIDRNGNSTAASNHEVAEESDSLRDLGVVPTTVPDHLVGAHQPVIKRPSDLDSLAPVDVFDTPAEPRPEKPFLAAALKAKEAIDRNGNSTAASTHEVDEESDSLRDLGTVPTTVPDHLVGAHQP